MCGSRHCRPSTCRSRSRPTGDAAEAPAAVTLSFRAASGDAGPLTKAMAAAIAEINPTLTLTFAPLDSQVGDTLMRERLLAILSATFGVLAC